MLRGLILDLDGVIVDSHPAHKKAWKEFLNSVGKDVTDEDLEFVLEGCKRADILRHFLGNLSDQQVKTYGARKDALFKSGVPEIKPIHGLIEFLAEAGSAGLSMAVASCAGRSRVHYVLQQLRLEPCFQAILTGEDVDQGKPSPSIFLLAANLMHVSPSETLVCEDAVNGVAAAKSAHMKCLAIASNGRGPRLQGAGADKVAPDFSTVRLKDLRALFE